MLENYLSKFLKFVKFPPSSRRTWEHDFFKIWRMKSQIKIQKSIENTEKIQRRTYLHFREEISFKKSNPNQYKIFKIKFHDY